MKKFLLIVLAVIIALGIVATGLMILRGEEDTWICSGGQWARHGNPSAAMPTKLCPGAQVACTLEAKICPDGSSVGRQGPNCEFAPCPVASTASTTQMANPASVNCIQKGGKLEVVTEADGNQSGICKFGDNTQCEEWAFYRGECPNLIDN